MNKKEKILIAVLSVAAVLSFIWAAYEYKALKASDQQIEYSYQRNFYDLINCMENLSVISAKNNVASSAQYTMQNMAEVYRRCNEAAATLAALPLQHGTLTQTERFLNQSGDFAHAMLKKLINGEQLTKEERETLRNISAQTRLLSSELRTLQDEIDIGNLAFNSKNRNVQDGAITVDSSFAQINEDVQQYPTLIYDGPFSDHMEQRQPQGLTGDEISKEQAIERIKTLQNVMSEGQKYTARYLDETTANAAIPIYCFEVLPTDENRMENIHIDISQTGGHIIMISNSREVGKTSITADEAKEKAQEFLLSLGYRNMQDTYTTTDSNEITIAYVATYNDILLYPDQIKVKVALDNGQIVGLEAAGYFMSHTDRKLPAPQISQEEARKKISSELVIENEAIALIPTDSGKEVLCYEFRGKYNDETYIVYINAITGTEENILQVIDTEGGQFTM